ncbi:MAG: ABC transporter permease [Parvularculaceae bacterium]|nr:ABC transporter permease [Parvularculaceae bacterium]
MSGTAVQARGFVRILRLFDPVRFSVALVESLKAVVSKAPLAWSLARRDVTSRHKDQFLGPLWTIAHPVMQMLIFLFIFGVVFKMRLDQSFDMPRDYTAYILSGLIPWIACVPAITASCASIVSSSGLVKQFHFDTFLLPLRDVMMTFFFWGVGLAFLLLYLVATPNGLSPMIALLPVALLFTFLMLVGIAWMLAALTVFFKDLKEVVIVLMTMAVYVLPIVYLPQWTPKVFQGVILFNPLSYLVWVYQDIFYFGRFEHPTAWIVTPLFSLICLSFGYRIFARLKPYFGNAL